MLKQICAVLSCAAVFSVSSIFGEDSSVLNGTISFTNESGSKLVTVTKDDRTFAGLYNEVTADFTSEKLDFGIDSTLNLVTNEQGRPDQVSWSRDDFDWYLTIRPVTAVAIGFSTDIFMKGSYLAVEDDNISGGNIGGDGLSVAYSGIPGLTLAVSAPFGFDSEDAYNWFAHDDDSDGTTYFNVGFGAEYQAFDKASLGVAVHNVANTDAAGFGIYGAVTAIKGLGIYGGYAYRDSAGLCDISGEHLFNASVAYESGRFTGAADYIANTSSDMYAGVSGGFQAMDVLKVEAGGTVSGDRTDLSNAAFVLKPAVIYTPGRIGEFKAEVDIAFTDKDFDSVEFPIYWKYSF